MSKTDLIPTAEAARILRVNVRTVHRMAADGRLKIAVRIPGLRGPCLFERADVEAAVGTDAWSMARRDGAA